MAVVESAEREVVVEFGVPLLRSVRQNSRYHVEDTHGVSVGVSGFEGGSGIPIKVGVAIEMAIWSSIKESRKVG